MLLSLFLLRQRTFRIEILDMAAFGPGLRIDYTVDKCGLTRRDCFGERILKAGAIGGVISFTAKRLDQFVVARALRQDRRRWLRTAAVIDVVAAIDAAVVEHRDRDRQSVAANGFYLHAAEA